MARTPRLRALAAILAAGLGLLAWRATRSPTQTGDEGAFAWVATARQLGVVGYRDPPGVLAPDGRFVAFAEGRDLRVVPVGGGAARLLARAQQQIRHLTWAGAEAVVFEDTADPARWWRVALDGGAARPLWPDREAVSAGAATIRLAALRQLAISPDARWAAGVAQGPEGAALWRVALEGRRADRVPVPAGTAAPAWLPWGELACVVREGGRARLSDPCGAPGLVLTPDVDVIGPLAVSPDGAAVYFASPNARGFVDLWRADRHARRARRITAFSRDTYAPSVAADGTVLFRLQSYRTHVTELDLASGRTRQLTAFQAETPSYHPDGTTIAVTYGTWRRVVDDARYPDIAQEIGLVHAGAAAGLQQAPATVVADSDSEDQAMAWSPNGRWIAFHSHREQSDDVWLRPVDGSRPDRRISFLGRGAEVGWPRWSPDGRQVLFNGASPRTGRSALFVIEVDQATGQPGTDAREITMDGLEAEPGHAEWLPDSSTVVALAKEAPGRHVVLTVPASGGRATVRHRFDSEHDFAGIAVSPDGTQVAFVAPASDGRFQIHRMPLEGGAGTQVTLDGGDKTQPAWSPDGSRLAFTVWSYDSQFWTWRP